MKYVFFPDFTVPIDSMFAFPLYLTCTLQLTPYLNIVEYFSQSFWLSFVWSEKQKILHKIAYCQNLL